MRTHKWAWLALIVLLGSALLTACQGETQEIEVTRIVKETVVEERVETVVQKETVVETVVEKETVVEVVTPPPQAPARPSLPT
jgi:hypothetical protein